MKKKSGEYWDERLVQSPKNPYPLAPYDLVKRGEINDSNYHTQNKRFGSFCERIMKTEIKSLDHNGEITIFGIGLARDLGWIEAAIPSFGIKMWDYSEVACRNATIILRPRVWLQLVEITSMEVMSGWESGHIDTDGVVAIYASQFLEHQGDSVKWFARFFGKFLRVKGRKIYLVIPRLEDNPPDKVMWNSASPPKDEEWQIPVLSGSKGLAKIEAIGTHFYFHRKYTFFRLST